MLPHIQPIAPTQIPAPFNDADFIFELKHDGFRAMAYVEDGSCRLVSRKSIQYKSFAGLATALGGLKVRDAILDGELVCLDNEGRSQFKTLMSRRSRDVLFYVFDCLWLDGQDLRPLALMHRKRVLRHVLNENKIGSLLYADYVEESGAGFYKAVCDRDCEGIVAKHRQGPYTSAPISWFKVINPNYSQHVGRGEMFDKFHRGRRFLTMSRHDPETAVRRETDDLAFALYNVDRITPPELPRPAVAYGAPPTQELLAWAVKVYFYSVLCQFRELLRATLMLVDNDLTCAVFFCSRGLFELAAHAYYVKKHLIQHLKTGDLKAAWQFLFEINLGSRTMGEKPKPEGYEPDYPEGPHIAKVMACFNEYFPNGHKEKPATETYSNLSEFSHPNCFAFINHFEWETDVRNLAKVTFGKPSRNLLTLCLPAANLAVTAFLDSTGRLMGSIGDDEIFKVIEKMIHDLIEHHDQAEART